MKIIKKTSFILLLLFVSRLIAACCNCPSDKILKFTVDSIAAVNLDNAGAAPVVSGTNVVSKNAYGVRLQLSYLIVQNKITGSMFSEAYAECFCGPGVRFSPKDTITSIAITSLNDFDDAHPANSVVTDYFKVLDSARYVPVAAYLAKKDPFTEGDVPSGLLEFYLLYAPKATGDYQFQIDIKLGNNKMLSAKTAVVTLN